MNTESRIRKEVSTGQLVVSRVYKSDYQKEGTLTAELKQTITTKSFYPTKAIANSLNGNVFSTSDFGFTDQEYTSTETRVAWIDVPVNSTVDTVKAKLAQFPEAGLYRIMSNHPIISDTEKYAINSPELNVNVDTFADRQAVRYPDNAENGQGGKLAVDTNGKLQYRRVAFSPTKVEDIDQRTAETADYYASASLEAELNGTVEAGTMPSQSLGG